MDRTIFLEKLFSMFPMNFNENNTKYWVEAYETVFMNIKLDYERLFYIMITTYKYTNSAPSPQWFKENMSSCIIREEKSEALKHIEAIRNEKREEMPEDLKERLKRLKEKISMGVKVNDKVYTQRIYS